MQPVHACSPSPAERHPSKVDQQRPPERASAAHLLADGSVVELGHDEVRIVDTEGRLLVRYRDGHAEISAPHGDVTFSAPHGHVNLLAGKDVTVQPSRDLNLAAGRCVATTAGEDTALRLEPTRAELCSPRLDVAAAHGRVVVQQGTMTGDRLTTKARVLVQHVERYERVAQRVVQRAESVLHEVSDVIDTRVGRLRTLVDRVATLRTGRTVMISKEETSIDGERILLG